MDIYKVLKYVLYGVAAILGVMIINTWNKDYPPQAVSDSTATSISTEGNGIPQPFILSSQAVSSHNVLPPAHTNHVVSVKTDVLDVQIDTDNATIISTHLIKYPVSVDQKHSAIQILNTNPENLYLAQSGILNIGDQPIRFYTTQTQYVMQPDQRVLNVVFKGQTQNGLHVEKTYTFTRNDYAIASNIMVENNSSSLWQGGFYHRIIRKNNPEPHAYLQRSSYNGAAISTPDTPYHKVTFKELAEANLDQTVVSGFIAMQQPYFVTSWIPKKGSINKFYSTIQGGDDNGVGSIATLGYVSPQVQLLPGKTVADQSIFYVGPELEHQLAKASPALVGTIDYGWAAPISVFIFWFMQKIFWLVGNWGWTIVLITLFIKMVFYPLSDKSYKSMAKMREAQPRIKALQERYADDKQALNKAVMEFYRSEKLNPMSGCLPMVIQIPVFFALYYVLVESVQLRQAPFIFWIHDLSVRDPYFILPLLMGASMFIQQKLSPPPPDPMQAKVMLFMPVMFTVMFLWFPSGLVLYWLTNNVLSILHQWYLLKTYHPKKEHYKQRTKNKK